MIFLGIKYEPLSPPPPPIIKICERGPWVAQFLKTENLTKNIWGFYVGQATKVTSSLGLLYINKQKSLGGYSYTLTILVCAASQGMVFRPSSLEQGI